MSAPHLRAVLLDALGTLVALAPPGPELVQALLREHGIAISRADADRAFAREMAYYREHHHEAHDESTLEALRARCAAVLAEALPGAVANMLGADEPLKLLLASLRFSAQPDARRALTLLRARALRAVVVSNWDCSLPSVLARVGLAGQLDGVVSSGAVGHPKPAREIFDAALAVAGVSPAQALHVGDSIANDVQGARAAGIAAVLLRRDPAGECVAVPPGVPVISSLDELPAVIAGAGG